MPIVPNLITKFIIFYADLNCLIWNLAQQDRNCHLEQCSYMLLIKYKMDITLNATINPRVLLAKLTPNLKVVQFFFLTSTGCDAAQQKILFFLSNTWNFFSAMNVQINVSLLFWIKDYFSVLLNFYRIRFKTNSVFINIGGVASGSCANGFGVCCVCKIFFVSSYFNGI